MTNAEKLTLQKRACQIRLGVIEGTHSAKCGHPGGSLSIAEVLSYLYFKEMNVDPANPAKADRDRLVLSKGHVAPALYAVLARWRISASSCCFKLSLGESAASPACWAACCCSRCSWRAWLSSRAPCIRACMYVCARCISCSISKG